MTSCGIFPSGDFRSGSLRKATTNSTYVMALTEARLGLTSPKLDIVTPIQMASSSQYVSVK